MKRQTAWLLLVLALVACTSVKRVDKADLAQEFYDFAHRAQLVSDAYQSAYKNGLITDKQADAWNTYVVRLKREFVALAEHFDLVSEAKQLLAIKAELKRMWVELDGYAREVAQ